jgi:methylaspartate ammonia-lyase
VTCIVRVFCVPAVGAGYCEDLAALQEEPMPLLQSFAAAPVTPGFRAIREVAEVVSVGLELGDTGQDLLGSSRVAWGDCVGVAYSGKAGRDPVFRSTVGLKTITNEVVPLLEGRRISSFRELAGEVDSLTEQVQVPRPRTARAGAVSRRELLAAPGRAFQSARGENESVEWVAVERRLHTAIGYGVSQALLSSVALSRGLTMTEIIAEEWGLPLPSVPVPIHAQSGSERRVGAEKMIARRIGSLPHALVDNIAEQVGAEGSEMTRYLRWLVGRIRELGDEDYSPTIHLDLHGALGQICDHDLGRVLGQLYAWELASEPYPLRIESPMVLGSREDQIGEMKTLREYIRARGMKCQLVADEWANTLDDIQAFARAQAVDMIHVKMPSLGSVHNSVDAALACKACGVGVLLGGSYVETDLSARVTAQVALATQPDLVMAKPGIGVDVAIAFVQNEMVRTLVEIAAREGTRPEV